MTDTENSGDWPLCKRTPTARRQTRPFPCGTVSAEKAHMRVMNLDLTDEKKRRLSQLLCNAIDDDRYPLLPRIQALKTTRSRAMALASPFGKVSDDVPGY